MSAKSKRLTVLSEAEQEALYGLPDLNDGQLDYLSLSEAELAIASSRPSLHAQAYCIRQIGYFKAKQAFFRFTWPDVEEDFAFVLGRYFHDERSECLMIADHAYYTQRRLIAELFGYRLWSSEFLPDLTRQAAQIAGRDVTPSFVAAELIVWLNEHEVIRPVTRHCRT
jgi:hypothetical protein